MNSRNLLSPALYGIALCGLALLAGSCRKKNNQSQEYSRPPAVVAPELATNNLGSLQGAVYCSQSSSPIHWQPWTKASLSYAKNAQRLVFCVIAMPQQSGFQKVLAALERDPAVVQAINDRYVPILVDGDASREIGLLTADLCAEIKRPLQMPVFVWMTFEGNPVAWIPVAAPEASSVAMLFNQSHSMVTQMWSDDWHYVIKNSRLDNTNRRKRMEQRKLSKNMSAQPAADMARSLRQLASLYDPYSRTFDEAGGLIPSGTLELLATASVRPELPHDIRARSLETTREILADLLPSAMFDALDGGVFSSRRGTSWALPSFIRNCQGQARVAVALIEASLATKDSKALEKALGVISFAEKTYTTSEGLFAAGLAADTNPKLWMWTVEDIEKELGPQDAAWWIKATSMKGLGNLPSEIDPRREFFRANTLGFTRTVAEIATELGQPVESFTPRFEAAKAKLLAARDKRLGGIFHDDSSHAAASFRMVSAYAAAFRATGDEGYRNKAVTLLRHARQTFTNNSRLRLFSNDAPDSISSGRAFLYALALQAALDVETITSDAQWLVWATDLATSSTELFFGKDFLKECPDEAKLINLPITDLVMLFDDSSVGLFSMSESRLAAAGCPLLQSFSDLVTPLPVYTIDRPILHTDLLLATLNRHYNTSVIMGENLPPTLKSAVERMSTHATRHRKARPEDNVPAGSVKLVHSGAGNKSQIISTPEALQNAVLPSADNN